MQMSEQVLLKYEKRFESVMENINRAAEAIRLMDEYSRKMNPPDKLWGDHFAESINKRNGGIPFTLRDHVRAMVYSMLSAERPWLVIAEKENQINEIFYDFYPDRIMAESFENFVDKIRKINCGNRRIRFQMKALKNNIEKLKSFEQCCGSVDEYYVTAMGNGALLSELVVLLSDSRRKEKLKELGVPLASEYLRRVGYDIPKPDRHIQRVLGSRILGCTEKEIATYSEVFGIFQELKKALNKSACEIDSILWTYCAKGYEPICTATDPKCTQCVASEYCITGRRKKVSMI